MNLQVIQFQYNLEFFRPSYSQFLQSFQDVIRWNLCHSSKNSVPLWIEFLNIIISKTKSKQVGIVLGFPMIAFSLFPINADRFSLCFQLCHFWPHKVGLWSPDPCISSPWSSIFSSSVNDVVCSISCSYEGNTVLIRPTYAQLCQAFQHVVWRYPLDRQYSFVPSGIKSLSVFAM